MNGKPRDERSLITPPVKHYSYTQRSKNLGKLEEKKEKGNLRYRHPRGGKIDRNDDSQSPIGQSLTPVSERNNADRRPGTPHC
jgi:hypothetical protein